MRCLSDSDIDGDVSTILLPTAIALTNSVTPNARLLRGKDCLTGVNVDRSVLSNVGVSGLALGAPGRYMLALRLLDPTFALLFVRPFAPPPELMPATVGVPDLPAEAPP